MHLISMWTMHCFLLLFQYDAKIKAVALSVLINLCSHNRISLELLEKQINLVDLQKKIPLDTYGILVSIFSGIADSFSKIFPFDSLFLACRHAKWIW